MAVATEQMRIDDPRVAALLLHPTRARVLAAMREPKSATEVARELGLPAPRVNHHVHKLRDAGLLRRAGTRRVRNLNENLYVALARTFVIAESLTPGGDRRRALRTGSERRPLKNLVALGERLAGDALVLLDQAACDERECSTYATSLDLSFADPAARAAFLGDLLEAIRELRARYGVEEDGTRERYKAIVACYPAP